MAIAVKEMMRTQGGYTLVCNGEIYGTLPLPVMGLMSDAGYECKRSTCKNDSEGP